MAATLFKGFKQVKQATYDAAVAAGTAKGYIWFVRQDRGTEGVDAKDLYSIYLGSRKYGTWTENLELAFSLLGAEYNETAQAWKFGTNKNYGTLNAAIKALEAAIAGKDYSGVTQEGKAVINVTEEDGAVSAVTGNINAEFVNIADTGSVITATNVEGALQEIAAEIDGMDLAQVGEAGKFIQAISETDGKVYATAATLNAAAVAQSSAKAAISADTTVQAALDSLADKVAAQAIDSADETVKVTSSADGTDLAVNIDNQTIVKSASGVLSTSLALSSITPSSATVKEEYALVDASGVSHGASIKVYKDSALSSVTLVNLETQPQDWPAGQTFEPGQYLRFDYLNAEGEHDIVYLNVSEFLIDAEFASGVTVTDGIAHGVVDPASEGFLTVGAAGFKLSGVQDAIDGAIEALDVTGDTAVAGQYISAFSEEDGIVSVSRANVSAAVLNEYTKGSDATAVAATDTLNQAISKLENQIDAAKAAASTVVEQGAGNVHVTVSASTAADGHKIYTINESDVASATALTAEIAARKAVDGVNGDAYTADTNAHYINAATSLFGADQALDTAIYNEVTARTAAIEALDAPLVSGGPIVSISETDGVISAATGTIEDNQVMVSAAFSGESGSGLTTANTAHEAMQAAFTAIDALDAGAYTGVTATNGISASDVENNGQVLSVKLETSTDALVADGHTAILLNANGEMYGAMYFDGDDVEA